MSYRTLSFYLPLSPAVKPPHANARVYFSMKCGLGSVLVLGCAGEIRHCSQLRELSLEANRLSAPVIDLRSLAHLRSLQLFGNPLDFLPELTPCSSLRHLSLANVSSPCQLFVQNCNCVLAHFAAFYVHAGPNLALMLRSFRQQSLFDSHSKLGVV